MIPWNLKRADGGMELPEAQVGNVVMEQIFSGKSEVYF